MVYPVGVFEESQNPLVRLGSQALVIMDEPHDAVVFDGLQLPAAPSIVVRCVTTYSRSKSQALPGERIGYLALSPRIAESAPLRDARTFANRTLGYINAPAIWQLVVAETGECKLSTAVYQEKRDRPCPTTWRSSARC